GGCDLADTAQAGISALSLHDALPISTMQTFLMLLYGTDSDLYSEEDEKWVVDSDGFLDSLKFIDDVYTNDLGASLSWGLTGQAGDRKSTRLNSSHVSISYAVFCLQKK